MRMRISEFVSGYEGFLEIDFSLRDSRLAKREGAVFDSILIIEHSIGGEECFVPGHDLGLNEFERFFKEKLDKEKKYALLAEQVKALVEGETDAVAKMANVVAAIHHEMGFFWTGFYRVIDKELVLGPFQGPVACVHIPYGKGVCGSAWKERRTLVVPDVEQFPGHIACSSLSRSEIVVPVFGALNEIVAVLDIDSTSLGTFDDCDRLWLETICESITL